MRLYSVRNIVERCQLLLSDRNPRVTSADILFGRGAEDVVDGQSNGGNAHIKPSLVATSEVESEA